MKNKPTNKQKIESHSMAIKKEIEILLINFEESINKIRILTNEILGVLE